MTELYLQNKIKGDFAEAVCKAHFEAMGYSVEKIGIENIATHYVKYLDETDCDNIYLSLIRKNLQILPDFIVSKQNGKQITVFLVETKYRKDLKTDTASLKELETSLFWQYRTLIWNKEFVELLKKNNLFGDFWEEDLCDSNKAAVRKVMDFYYKAKSKKDLIQLPIVFYVVTNKADSYVMISKSDFNGFKKPCEVNKTNISQLEDLNKTYDSVVLPVLREFFEK